MIEEIFDLRHLIDYNEILCSHSHKKELLKTPIANENIDKKKVSLNKEIEDIVKLADIEVTIRLIGNLGLSTHEKDYISYPEVNYVKKTKLLLKTVPEDTYVYIQCSNVPIRYTNDSSANKNEHVLLTDLPLENDYELEVHNFMDEIYDESLLYNDDEENCLDQEDANMILIKDEPFNKNNHQAYSVVRETSMFEKLLQTNLTAQFLSDLNINVYDGQCKKERVRSIGRSISPSKTQILVTSASKKRFG